MSEHAVDADDGFSRRALAGSLIFVAVLTAAAALWYTSYALAPMLLGALFGIFVHELSGSLRRLVPVGERWAVGLTLLLLLAALLLLCYALGMRMEEQLQRFFDMLPKGVEAARGWLERNPRLESALHRLRGGGGAQLTEGLRGIGSAVKMTFGLGVAVFTAFFTGVFLAFSPSFYSDGVARLVPEPHRPRCRRLLSDLWRSLWLWTLGRFLVMGAIALGHAAAYWLLGVPLPFVLGLIAGAAAFVPFLGPVVATVPAVLIALTKSPSLALWVVVVHAAVETVESHVLTPLTQKYMVDVPALVTIGSFLAFGEMMGVMGVVVATPLAAALIVAVRDLYLDPRP